MHNRNIHLDEIGSRLVYINPDFVAFIVHMSRLALIKPSTVRTLIGTGYIFIPICRKTHS